MNSKVFSKKVNPAFVITVTLRPDGRIDTIKNPFRYHFPFKIGQLLQRNVESWACVNGFLIDGKDPCPEKKIFGVRISDVPQGHEWRLLFPGMFKSELSDSFSEGGGLYVGPSHEQGGIPVTVIDNHDNNHNSARQVEVEGEEYKICREAYQSPEVITLDNVTNLEALHYIHKEFACKFEQPVADGGDFIICKRVVKSRVKHHRHGTVKQIINQMQAEGGCKVEDPREINDIRFAEGGLTNNVTEVLSRATVRGNVVMLPPGQLDRNVYMDVAKALEGIGGKWNRKEQGFVFPSDPADLLAQVASGQPRNLKKEFQFFATPDLLADKLVQKANIDHFKPLKILEPSAGQGAIINAIHRKYPELVVHCYELSPVNRTVLEKLPNTVVLGNDFLESPVADQYDLIIANPPFSKNQDIDHIRAMYERLKPGGRLVTIASQHWLHYNSRSKEVMFMEWLKEIGAVIEEIPEGTFKESGTNVATVMITIDKPEQKSDDDFFEQEQRIRIMQMRKAKEAKKAKEAETSEVSETSEVLQQPMFSDGDMVAIVQYDKFLKTKRLRLGVVEVLPPTVSEISGKKYQTHHYSVKGETAIYNQRGSDNYPRWSNTKVAIELVPLEQAEKYFTDLPPTPPMSRTPPPLSKHGSLTLTAPS